MEGGDWATHAGPWARAQLPDGQELDVIVTARYRSGDGKWWYECEAILPSRHETADGHTESKGVPTAISVLAEDITPIPGENYTALPSEGVIAGRQWLLQPLHRYLEQPVQRLHRRDCWQARSAYRRITTAEAAGLLGSPSTDVCDVCRPDRALPR